MLPWGVLPAMPVALARFAAGVAAPHATRGQALEEGAHGVLHLHRSVVRRQVGHLGLWRRERDAQLDRAPAAAQLRTVSARGACHDAPSPSPIVRTQRYASSSSVAAARRFLGVLLVLLLLLAVLLAASAGVLVAQGRSVAEVAALLGVRQRQEL
jgi:hypothetical protein